MSATDVLKPPTPTARKFVRYMRGFAVVGLLCIPLAAASEVPGISKLADFLPRQLGPILIFAAILMSAMCLFVELYAGERIPRDQLQSLVPKLGMALALAFLLLLPLDQFFVLRETMQDGRTLSVLIGLEERTGRCPCPANVSDSVCVSRLQYQADGIKTCWGRGTMSLITLSMLFLYLFVAFVFSTLVGILILKEKVKRYEQEQVKQQRRQSRQSPTALEQSADRLPGQSGG